jgi:thiol:disulfide interchange protein DsbA
MKKLFLLLIISVNVWSFDSEIDYDVLKKPIATSSTNSVEVKELFWYDCPHCFNLEADLNKWLKTMDASATFIRQPAVFSKRWVNGAVFFYTLEKLNLLESLHVELFKSIHKHHKKFNSAKDFINWVVVSSANKVSFEQVEKVMRSFKVKTNVRKAQKQSKDYKVTGVPSFVVNGKYTTSVSQVGSEAKLFEVLDFLIKKEKALLK